jgi:hypothetical protein
MPSRDPLPPEWAFLEGKVDFVQRHSENEWSASCPHCSDAGHSGNTWPDRFRMWRGIDHDPPFPRAWCRREDKFFLPSDFGEFTPLSHEELEERRQHWIAQAEDKKRSAEKALEALRNDALWRRYHEQLDEQGRKHWRGRGIPDWAQDMWSLSYLHEWEYYWNKQRYISAVEMIPVFEHGWVPRNIRVRIDNAPAEVGRYRKVYENIPDSLYLTNPDLPVAGECVVAEGEVKSMVTYLRLEQDTRLVVGIPGKHPNEDITAQLRHADRLTLVADPDAKTEMVRLAKKVGWNKCYLLHTPEKIDDACIQYDWSSRDVQRLLKGAIKLADFVSAS